MQHKHRGFSVVELLVVVAAIGILVFIGTTVFFRSSNNPARPITQAAKDYPYTFWIDNLKGGWMPTKTAPACPDPPLTMSPVDTARVTDYAFPGQWRGAYYKPHGLFALARNNSSNIEVRLPLDASLVGITKYKEEPANDPQYLLEFQHECGFMVRFDHLNTLGPDFASYEASLPTQTGTASAPLEVPLGHYKAGTLVATGAGLHKNVKGGGFDFGIYDLRQPNKISGNAQWAALHKVEESHTFYGICWLDYLPKADKDRILSIQPFYIDDRVASDYCSYAPGGTTLQYNNGNAVPDNGRAYRAHE